MSDYGVLTVEVVAITGKVWEGQAENVIVRTVDGDLGILPGHSPVLAVLQASAAEIITSDGQQLLIAVDGGYISVEKNHGSVLAQYATLADKIDESAALDQMVKLQALVESGRATEDEYHRYHLARAQVRVIRKLGRETPEIAE